MDKLEFVKLHEELVQKTLDFSKMLIHDGVERMSWTLGNDTVVTIKNSKKSFKNFQKEREK